MRAARQLARTARAPSRRHQHSASAASSTPRVRYLVVGGGAAIGVATIAADPARAHAALRDVVSFDDMSLSQKSAASKKLKTKQEHPTHSALDGGKVTVELDPEVVADLPLMSLEEVEAARADKGSEQLLCTYEGIVYDVTEFAEAHPGGKELLLTATGCDLAHYFKNYTVHGHSDKAANWLAPLAVGRLTPADAARAAAASTPARHVERRLGRLRNARRRLAAVACCLPAAIGLRETIRFIGAFLSKTVARWLASALPIAVPGYSPGAEPLPEAPEGQSRGKVAVVGGGIAGCGAAWMLARDGFEVTLFEARPSTSGNARTFDWVDDVWTKTGTNNTDRDKTVKSCVSVTAWPALLYKNYTALLKHLKIETCPMPLSWFLVSKVPGYEGTLWGADPRCDPARGINELREVFRSDFTAYRRAERFAGKCTDFFTLAWAPWKWRDTQSMYTNHTGLGMLNPLNVVPLYAVYRALGGSDDWWDIVFTPYYTASFLVDELRPFPAVFGPIIEAQIPLHPDPDNSWHGPSWKSKDDCKLTTCVTWRDAGTGIREVFAKLVEGVDLRVDTRVLQVQVLPDGRKRVVDEHDNVFDVDRVVLACPALAAATMLKRDDKALEETVLHAPVYADDHHPATGHMHAVMHSDASVIDPRYREEFLARGSNYVEVTRLKNGEINIENQYNFGIQTPGPGVADLKLDEKPVMLISHALGEGKKIDANLVRGGGNHARAHPLYSGWNVMAQLSLRLCQGPKAASRLRGGTSPPDAVTGRRAATRVEDGRSRPDGVVSPGRDGVYYCSNWTTPGNCHDMSLLSGMLCAHAIGAKYPFPDEPEARKDFHRLNDLMGVF